MKPWELVNFCEIDKYASKAYCAIHDESPDKNLGDITKVDENNVPEFNVIFGGSPCQDFSVAGKGAGSMWTCRQCGHSYNPITVHYSKRDRCPMCGSQELDKTRSSLLVEWLRMIRANKPKWGIYENVKNIVSKRFKETFDLFISELNEYGYNTYWKVLNAKDYGVPQNRERVYVVIVRKELDNGAFWFPQPFDNGKRLRDVLEQNVDGKYYVKNDGAEKLIVDLFNSGKLQKEFSNAIRTSGGGDSADRQALLGCSVSENGKKFEKVVDIAGCRTARDGRGQQKFPGYTEVITKDKV